MLVYPQLSAALAEIGRIEATVWDRNPVDALLAYREKLLPYLMTRNEHSRWRAIKVAVEEMRRYD